MKWNQHEFSHDKRKIQGKYIALLLVSVFVGVVLAIVLQPVTRIRIPLAKRRDFGSIMDVTTEKTDALNHLL